MLCSGFIFKYLANKNWEIQNLILYRESKFFNFFLLELPLFGFVHKKRWNTLNTSVELETGKYFTLD